MNREDLSDLLFSQKDVKHITGQAANILPVVANRSTIIKNRFPEVIGEYVRYVTGILVNLDKLTDQQFVMIQDGHELSEFLAKDIEFKDDEAKHDFIRFIDSYLFDQTTIKAVHPYIYNFLETNPKEKNDFSKYGAFLCDVLAGENENIKEVFTNKDTNSILTELILDKIDHLKEAQLRKRLKTSIYEDLLPSLTELYKSDLMFLSKHEDYFLKYFPLLTHYYAFSYMMQLLVHLEGFTKSDYCKSKPLYYALDWESLTKRRKAADAIEGFKFVKEHSDNLFAHIQVLSQLSYNGFNEHKEVNKVLGYSELYKKIQLEGPEFEKKFIEELTNWIKDYMDWIKKPLPIELPQTFNELLKVFLDCIKHGTSDSVRNKYGNAIEHLGSGVFLKARGSLGTVLNMNHDLLMLMTAVIVKDERIPLNQLFEEFEKRGIKFDRYTIKEIIIVFNNHNILDKKSDSGDAQYVKPIL
ncbi:DNA phosphorothioation-dependent restriction protein DptG [Viridibacillus arvi]|uniref:DNA phosphorothioation-dependent restriction protein DptG n=1 Tax=Viridibacillus arvi TaxID=263475 RepID=UPI0034CDCE5E